MNGKLAVGLFIGLVGALWHVERAAWVHDQVGSFFKQAFDATLNCHTQYTVQAVHIFPPTLVVSDMVVAPADALDCSWRCKQATVSFSWLHFLLFGMVDLHLTFDDLVAHTACHGVTPDIITHIANVAQAPPLDLPLYIASCTVHRGRCDWHHQDIFAQGMLQFNGTARQMAHVLKIDASVVQGDAYSMQRQVMEQFAGAATVELSYHKNKVDVQVDIAAFCQAPLLPAEAATCRVQATWRTDVGTLSVRNATDSLVVNATTLTVKESGVELSCPQVTFPVALLPACINNSASSSVDGVCTVQGAVAWSDHLESVVGSATIADVSVRGMPLNITGATQCTTRGDYVVGGLAVLHNATPIFKNSYVWHTKKWWGGLVADAVHGVGTLRNNCLQIHGVQNNGKHRGTVALHEVALEGSVGQYNYSVHGIRSPDVVATGSVHDATGRVLASFGHHGGALQADVQMAFIKELLQQTTGIDLQGQGTVSAHLAVHDDAFSGALQLIDGVVRLPHTYNYVGDSFFKFSGSTQQNCVWVEDAVVHLHRGTISCKRATITLNDRGQLQFVQAPITLTRCLLNPQKDLFALISAQLLVSRAHADEPLQVSGEIIAEQSQLTESIFAHALHNELLQEFAQQSSAVASDVVCDLTITTRKPLRIKTPFITARAHAALQIKKSMSNPEISGCVTVGQGMLLFPYKPLRIVRGSVQFIPQRTHDPIIDLLARDQIKRHTVSMQVAGSAESSSLSFNASPGLSEQQIISLLLTGTEQESLSGVVPTLLMQKIKSSLFDASQAPFSLAAHGLKAPDLLQQINIVPSVVAQKGNKGLKGSLDITLNDRWRAMIAQSLTDTDDTHVELEYLMSDEVTLRTISNDWSDIGAEVEFRWKF